MTCDLSDVQAGIILVHAWPLVDSSDVQDLAEVAGAHGPARGILLVYAGAFTPDATRPAIELGDERLHPRTILPQAALGSARALNEGG